MTSNRNLIETHKNLCDNEYFLFSLMITIMNSNRLESLSALLQLKKKFLFTSGHDFSNLAKFCTNIKILYLFDFPQGIT